MQLRPTRPREATLWLPADWYLVALTWFTRLRGGSGKMYLRCSFRVVAGRHEGAQFHCGVSVDIRKPVSLRRWQAWSEAVGNVRLVELEDDRAVRQAFRGRAFKVRLREEVIGDGRTVNDIEFVAYPRQYTPEERAECERWNKAWQEGDGDEQPAGWYPGAIPFDDGPIDPDAYR